MEYPSNHQVSKCQNLHVQQKKVKRIENGKLEVKKSLKIFYSKNSFYKKARSMRKAAKLATKNATNLLQKKKDSMDKMVLVLKYLTGH